MRRWRPKAIELRWVRPPHHLPMSTRFTNVDRRVRSGKIPPKEQGALVFTPGHDPQHDIKGIHSTNDHFFPLPFQKKGTTSSAGMSRVPRPQKGKKRGGAIDASAPIRHRRAAWSASAENLTRLRSFRCRVDAHLLTTKNTLLNRDFLLNLYTSLSRERGRGEWRLSAHVLFTEE
jgi:hypothetical protein